MKRNLIYLFLLFSGMVNAQQKEISLYNGAAPGSEHWTWEEKMNDKNSVKIMTVYNTVYPSVTVVRPEPSIANGTAIIVCPGGGFHFLAINHEGKDVASLLIKKGITVFILKYRLVHIFSDNPFDDMVTAKDKKAWDDESLPIIPLAIADGRHAITYVRNHATEYHIDPQRIGIMGFSAGGMVAAASAFNYSQVNRPDFVVPIYADIRMPFRAPLPDAPPLFLACTQDDEFGFINTTIQLYELWYAAKRPVEMHLFTKGGHGFGIGNPSNTTYQWLDKFVEWLSAEGLLKSN
jgi:acetyl esterase/lipase